MTFPNFKKYINIKMNLSRFMFALILLSIEINSNFNFEMLKTRDWRSVF